MMQTLLAINLSFFVAVICDASLEATVTRLATEWRFSWSDSDLKAAFSSAAAPIGVDPKIPWKYFRAALAMGFALDRLSSADHRCA
jgi:hypothetical protein